MLLTNEKPEIGDTTIGNPKGHPSRCQKYGKGHNKGSVSRMKYENKACDGAKLKRYYLLDALYNQQLLYEAQLLAF